MEESQLRVHSGTLAQATGVTLTPMNAEATNVWNRACDYDFQPTRTGDKFLKAVIRFDGLANNGGLGHAIDVSEPGDVAEAVASLRQLGLLDAADVVAAALGLSTAVDTRRGLRQRSGM